MKSLHILYDSQVFAIQKYGGVSRIFYELIKHLSIRPDVRISLFQGLHINRFPLTELKDRLAGYYGKQVPAFPHISACLKKVNRFLFSMYRKGKHFDLYHPTNYSSTVSNWKQTPVVLNVNDMIPELYPNNYSDIKQRLIVKKKCIQRADVIIVISRNTGNDLQQYYNVPESKIRVVYPGAPEVGDKEDNMERNDSLPTMDRTRPYILYVGTRKQGYKNFYNFFRAYCAAEGVMNRFDLICVGGLPFSTKEQQFLSNTFPAQTQKTNISIFSDKVQWLPADERQLPGLYANAAALVYPSLYEGFGLPPVEAMTYGCPVIAAKGYVMSEVLGDAVAYFDPTSIESMASVMESVLIDSRKLEELITKGLDRAKLYSWEKMATETLRVYQEILGN